MLLKIEGSRLDPLGIAVLPDVNHDWNSDGDELFQVMYSRVPAATAERLLYRMLLSVAQGSGGRHRTILEDALQVLFEQNPNVAEGLDR